MADRLYQGPAGTPANIDTSSANVATNAYTQLHASTTKGASGIQFVNGTTKTLILAIGGAGTEVDTGLYIAPGNSGILPIRIPAASRLSLKALGATANSGLVTANLFG